MDFVNGQLPASMRCEKCGRVYPFITENQARPQAQWRPEDWKNLAEAARPLLDDWLQFQKDKESALARRLDLISSHNRKLSASLIVFLLVVVAGMGVLTAYGKVSGDALLFLVGTVTGYVVLMIQDLTAPIFEEPPRER